MLIKLPVSWLASLCLSGWTNESETTDNNVDTVTSSCSDFFFSFKNKERIISVTIQDGILNFIFLEHDIENLLDVKWFTSVFMFSPTPVDWPGEWPCALCFLKLTLNYCFFTNSIYRVSAFISIFAFLTKWGKKKIIIMFALISFVKSNSLLNASSF